MNLKGRIRALIHRKQLLRDCYLSECEYNLENLCTLDNPWYCNQKLIEIEEEEIDD